MNNKKKTIIAAAAGAALLAGTAGTFALWQDTVDVAGEAGTEISINVGQMFIANKDAFALTNLGFNVDSTVAENGYWVPGDSLTATVDIVIPAVEVTETGDNLEWELTFVPNADLDELLVLEADNVEAFEIKDVTGTWSLVVDIDDITSQISATEAQTAQVSVVLTFEKGNGEAQVGTVEGIDVLGTTTLGGTITLQQVRPTADA